MRIYDVSGRREVPIAIYCMPDAYAKRPGLSWQTAAYCINAKMY